MPPLLFRRSKTPREIPGALLRSAIMGTIVGPFVAVLSTWLADTQAPLLRPAGWVLRDMGIGAVFGMSFYVTCGMPWVFLRPFLGRIPRRLFRIFSTTVSAAGGAAGAMLSSFSTQLLFGFRVVPESWMTRMLVLDSLIVIVIGVFMGVIDRTQREAAMRESELAEAAARAQAYALQSQIAPHFFFNSLNSVSALIPVDPRAAQEMIGRLASIFRYTFTQGTDELVSLERELEFVREYLLLEKIRYRERLNFQISPVAEELGIVLPGLTLQPIVENAIRHGISKRIEGGTVRIVVEFDDGCCRISVWNQYDPVDGAPDVSEAALFPTGHALLNVRRRLELVFGQAARIALCVGEEDWVCATLTLPAKGVITYARANCG